jgi:hypothetical protein
MQLDEEAVHWSAMSPAAARTNEPPPACVLTWIWLLAAEVLPAMSLARTV